MVTIVNVKTSGERMTEKKVRYIKCSRDGKERPLHRMMMQDYIGRKLLKREVVHHIDGNKINNRIENLRILDIGDHARLHFKDKKRPCVTRYEIVDKLPEPTEIGRIVSLLPDYRTYKCICCEECGNIFWVRKDKKTRTCVGRCSLITAWKEGKYGSRRKKTSMASCT